MGPLFGSRQPKSFQEFGRITLTSNPGYVKLVAKTGFGIIIIPIEGEIMSKSKSKAPTETPTPFRKTVIHLETTPENTIKSEIKNANFELVLQVTIPFIVDCAKKVCHAAEHNLNPTIPALDKKKLTELKTVIYDQMNIAFSNALDMFAPEIAARPNLNEEAILAFQDKVFVERMQKAGFLREDGSVNPDFEGKLPEYNPTKAEEKN